MATCLKKLEKSELDQGQRSLRDLMTSVGKVKEMYRLGHGKLHQSTSALEPDQCSVGRNDCKCKTVKSGIHVVLNLTQS